MTPEEATLYQRICDFSLDDSLAEYPLSRRLARENNWSKDYTQRVLTEYKKFMFLTVVASHWVTPSHAIDKAWHLHLIYTDSYWNNFCSKVIGKPIHHRPSKGGLEQAELFFKLYTQTLASYQAIFGNHPPEDIWPSPEQRFAGVALKPNLNLTPKIYNSPSNSSSEIFKVHDILNQCYQLQRRLGNTAKGRQTWLALHIPSGELVVVKLLAFSPDTDWKEIELFEREALTLKELNHERIPRYQDSFEVEAGVTWFALVQDYVQGQSLQDLLDQGKRFSEDEIRSIITEVIKILIYLHSLSPLVLHRDIKPSNLILDRNNRVYLVDFGAVQAEASVTGMTFSIVGTGGYAPPEQFYGKATVTSDLYALGATIIHLTTGIPPIELYGNDGFNFQDKVNLNNDLISWLEKVTDPVIENRFENSEQALEKLKSGVILVNPNVVPVTVKKSSEYFEVNFNYKSKNQLQIQLTNLFSGLVLIFLFIWIFFLMIVSNLQNVSALSLLLMILLYLLPYIMTFTVFIRGVTSKTTVFKRGKKRFIQLESESIDTDRSSGFYFNLKSYKIISGGREIGVGKLEDVTDLLVVNNCIELTTKHTTYRSDILTGGIESPELETRLRNWLTQKGIKLKEKPQPPDVGCCATI